MVIYDILLAFGVALFLAVGWAYLRHPASSFFHPVTLYLAMHGIVFTARPILARIFDYRALYVSTQFEPSVADKVTVLLAADLALVVFVAVSLLIAGRPVPGAASGIAHDRACLWVPFVVVAGVVAPIAILAAITEWNVAATNSTTMILDRAMAVNYNTVENGWFATSQLALVPLVAIFAWLTRFRWYSLIPFAGFVLLRAGTGGRGPIIVATLAIVILYLLDRGRKWPEWRSVSLIVLAALAFVAIVQDRGKAVRAMFIAEEASAVSERDDIKPFEHMDFANLEFFEFAVYAVPQRSGTYDYFLHNLQLLTEPVPRIWWKDKPLGSPIAMYRLADYGRPYGFTYSVPGVGWMAWGWPGVVIQAAIFALLFGWIHRRMADRPATPIFTLIFALMIASTVVSYRDGTLLTVVRVLPFYIGPIVAIWFLRFAVHRRSETQPKSARSLHLLPGAKGCTPAERRRKLAAMIE